MVASIVLSVFVGWGRITNQPTTSPNSGLRSWNVRTVRLCPSPGKLFGGTSAAAVGAMSLPERSWVVPSFRVTRIAPLTGGWIAHQIEPEGVVPPLGSANPVGQGTSIAAHDWGFVSTVSTARVETLGTAGPQLNIVPSSAI